MQFLFWLFFAVVVGFYADSKGRSGAGYFLLSLILSPLVVFVLLLILPTKPSNLEKAALAVGDVKKCPNCNELIQADSMMCEHCGCVLDGTDA